MNVVFLYGIEWNICNFNSVSYKTVCSVFVSFWEIRNHGS